MGPCPSRGGCPNCWRRTEPPGNSGVASSHLISTGAFDPLLRTSQHNQGKSFHVVINFHGQLLCGAGGLRGSYEPLPRELQATRALGQPRCVGSMAVRVTRASLGVRHLPRTVYRIEPKMLTRCVRSEAQSPRRPVRNAPAVSPPSGRTHACVDFRVLVRGACGRITSQARLEVPAMPLAVHA